MRTILSAMLALTVAAPATATVFEYVHEGWLAAPDSLIGPDGEDRIAGDVAFRFVALFDDTSPDLVSVLPFPGFKAWAPLSAEITILGETYRMVGAAEDPGYGIGISIFDPSNPIFPGYYGAGFIANPLADGAGIIADFGGASPDFSVESLVSTTFTGFRGAGFLAGIGCSPASVGPCVPRPLDLFAANGDAWLLGFEAPNASRDAPPIHSASLIAVPEPASWALLVSGFGVIGMAVRRRREAAA